MECFMAVPPIGTLSMNRRRVRQSVSASVYEASDVRVVSGAHQIATMPRP